MNVLALAQSNSQPNSWDTLIGIGIVVLGIACLWLLGRLIMHYFPSTRIRRTAGGNALMRVEATFLPAREHILEALERDEAEEDEQGDPPHRASLTARLLELRLLNSRRPEWVVGEKSP